MKIIASHSFKGGSGKTIFTINLCNLLTQKGFKVLYIEADFRMPTLSSYLEFIPKNCYLNDYLEDTSRQLSSFIHSVKDYTFDLLLSDPEYKPKQHIYGSDINWFNSNRKRLNNDLNKLDYDFILFDLSPGVDLFLINVLSYCQEVFVIIRPDYYSLRGVDRMIEEIYQKAINTRKIQMYIIFNQIPNIDEFKSEISSWKSYYEKKYSKLNDFFEIYYSEETALKVLYQQIILNSEDPTLVSISDILNELIINST